MTQSFCSLLERKREAVDQSRGYLELLSMSVIQLRAETRSRGIYAL